MDNQSILEQIGQFLLGLLSKGGEPMVKVEIPLSNPTPTPAPQPTAPEYKVTKSELLMGRDEKYATEYTQQISDNLDSLLIPINKLRDAWGKPMTVDSGWRPPEINNSTPGAATHSKHMLGLAVDIKDPDGELMKWTLQNLKLMQDLGLFMEDFRWTPDWCHYQLGAPVSGHRIFVPSAARPQAPGRWDGNYDHSFDTQT